MKAIICILWFVSMASSVTSVCTPSQDVCEFWLVVHETLSMEWKRGWFPVRVEAFESSLYAYDDTEKANKIPADQVITLDGVPRLVTVVNNTIPGPTITVYENQQVIVHLKNEMLTQSTSIHWHGLHQIGTPWMDGTEYVAQCPIGPGQTFTYKFPAYPKGTFFWHSHVGPQRLDGMFGSIIVKPRDQTNALPEHTMLLGDWSHKSGTEVHYIIKLMNFMQWPDFQPMEMPDGVSLAPIKFYSAHIEGRGRYKDPSGVWTQTPWKEYNVQRGTTYRFRMIGAGVIYPFRVSIDNHPLTVIATDGFDVEPRTFESIIISPGERFDFTITANQNADNYWIRVNSVQSSENYTRGILRYNAASTVDPNTNRMECTTHHPCTVLNCMFKYFAASLNTHCTLVSELKGKECVPPWEKDSQELFYNFIREGPYMYVNGNVHETTLSSDFTNMNAQHYSAKDTSYQEDRSCDRAQCTRNPERPCHCFNVKDLPYNKTIQMVLTVRGPGSQNSHPIHLHGHSFHVLKMGPSPQDRATGKRTGNNEDVKCVGSSEKCYNVEWSTHGHGGDNIPGLNLINPPLKDTLVISPGNYAVIRFRSNNPGLWMMHCHIDIDLLKGMGMIFNEAPTHLPSRPVGFPTCTDFTNIPSVDRVQEAADEPYTSKATDYKRVFKGRNAWKMFGKNGDDFY